MVSLHSLFILGIQPEMISGSFISKPATRKFMAKSPVAFSKQVVGT